MSAIVQGLWVEGPLSAMEELSVRSFLAQGHQVHVYTYDAGLALPPGARRLPAGEVLPESAVFRYEAGGGAGSYAGFSNLFRYKLLAERGGWWTDLDMVCLRPLAEIEAVDGHAFASERQRSGGATVTTGLILAPAGSPLLAECHERARSHPQRARVWGATGPALLREVVERRGAGAAVLPPEACCPIDWWRAADLLAPGEPPRGSFAVHLWQEKWRAQGWPKEPCYAPDVLYQRLHRLYPVRDDVPNFHSSRRESWPSQRLPEAAAPRGLR